MLDIKDLDFWIEALKRSGNNLKDMPPELIDEEICNLAMEQNIWAIQYVPDKFLGYDDWCKAVKKDAGIIQYVPDRYKDYNMCIPVIEKSIENNSIVEYIPIDILEQFKKHGEKAIQTLIDMGFKKMPVSSIKDKFEDDKNNLVYVNSETKYLVELKVSDNSLEQKIKDMFRLEENLNTEDTTDDINTQRKARRKRR